MIFDKLLSGLDAAGEGGLLFISPGNAVGLGLVAVILIVAVIKITRGKRAVAGGSPKSKVLLGVSAIVLGVIVALAGWAQFIFTLDPAWIIFGLLLIVGGVAALKGAKWSHYFLAGLIALAIVWILWSLL